MRSEKKNTGLAAGAVLIAILIIIQIGDSYCSVHIAKLNGRICGAKRSHSVFEQPNCYQSV